jgi:predicted Zn-dependent peptidase
MGQTAAGLELAPEEFAAQLEAVTREQVSAAARKLELDTIYFLKGKEG